MRYSQFWEMFPFLFVTLPRLTWCYVVHSWLSWEFATHSSVYEFVCKKCGETWGGPNY